MATATDSYLANHAEPSARWALAVNGRPSGQPWETAVVVPMYDERSAAVLDLCVSLSGRNALLVVVVNEPEHACERAVLAGAELVRFVTTHPGQQVNPNCWVGEIRGCAIAMLELTGRVGAALPTRHGVGAARKTGFDFALSLHAGGQLRRPWIYTTDADARLPADYLEAPLRPGAALAAFPFWHVGPADTGAGQAAAAADVAGLTALYELWLRYYAAGLDWAGSPYGIAVLGSTMAVSTTAYAAVRGWPKRAAGEDFYLASKLISVGEVCTPKTDPIQICARDSDRVPFGTGPAIARWRRHGTDEFYDPRVFEALADALVLLRGVEDGGEVPRAQTIDLRLAETWAELGVSEGLGRALRGANTRSVRQHRIRQWFDALKVLRFVHGVERAHRWPRLEAEAALGRAPFIDAPADPGVEAYRRLLAAR